MSIPYTSLLGEAGRSKQRDEETNNALLRQPLSFINDFVTLQDYSLFVPGKYFFN
jgi:hypothetical protein